MTNRKYLQKIIDFSWRCCWRPSIMYREKKSQGKHKERWWGLNVFILGGLALSLSDPYIRRVVFQWKRRYSVNK